MSYAALAVPLHPAAAGPTLLWEDHDMGELVSHGRCIAQLDALPYTLPYYFGGPRAELSE